MSVVVGAMASCRKREEVGQMDEEMVLLRTVQAEDVNGDNEIELEFEKLASQALLFCASRMMIWRFPPLPSFQKLSIGGPIVTPPVVCSSH